MKSEEKVKAECGITYDILEDMYNGLSDGEKEKIPTHEPEPEPIENLTIEQLKSEVQYLREWKKHKTRIKYTMCDCPLTHEQKVEGIVNAITPFFDLIVARGGKTDVKIGIANLFSKYRNK